MGRAKAPGGGLFLADGKRLPGPPGAGCPLLGNGSFFSKTWQDRLLDPAMT
jgi:hypothetical protein